MWWMMCSLTRWVESFHDLFIYQIITRYPLKYLIVLFVKYIPQNNWKNLNVIFLKISSQSKLPLQWEEKQWVITRWAEKTRKQLRGSHVSENSSTSLFSVHAQRLQTANLISSPPSVLLNIYRPAHLSHFLLIKCPHVPKLIIKAKFKALKNWSRQVAF